MKLRIIKTLLMLLVASLLAYCPAMAVRDYRQYEDDSYNRGSRVTNIYTYPWTRVAQPQQLFGGQPSVGADRKLQETFSERFQNSADALNSLGGYFSELKQSELLNEQVKEQKLRNKVLEEQVRNNGMYNKN